MKTIITALLVIIPWSISRAADLPFSRVAKASLAFRLDTSTMPYHYPHTVLVFLRLENQHDSDVTWVCNSVAGIEADLFDSKGHPVTQPTSAGSVPSAWRTYLLPFGSSLDWLISHGGIAMMGDAKENAALIVGDRGWLLPMKTLSSYSLKIRVKGLPWASSDWAADKQPKKLLFETPQTNIVIKGRLTSD